MRNSLLPILKIWVKTTRSTAKSSSGRISDQT